MTRITLPSLPSAAPSTPRSARQRLAPAWAWGKALSLPVAVLLAWQLVAHREWVSLQVLPAPLTVLETFRDLLDSGELREHLQISLMRVLAGFAIGSAVGLALGLAMGLSRTAKEYLYPTFRIVMQIPSLGWLPFLMLLLGIGETLKIVLIAKAAMVPVAVNTYDGLRHSNTHHLEVARVLGLTTWQRLTRVVLPAAFPPIWNGVRLGLTHAWLALVAVELLASSEGLGFLIVYGRQLYQLDVVMAAVVTVGAVGLLIDKLLTLVERRLLRWRREAF